MSARELLEEAFYYGSHEMPEWLADKIEDELAKPEPEPDYVIQKINGFFQIISRVVITGWPPDVIKLYAEPPQRKPLSDDEIIEIGKLVRAIEGNNILPVLFARAIEKAHGIE